MIRQCVKNETGLFLNLLKGYRKDTGRTQREMVEALLDFDGGFGGLNEVTYSRWETGVTVPTASKKGLLLRFLDAQGYLNDPEISMRIETCYETLSRKWHTPLTRGPSALQGKMPVADATCSIEALVKHPDRLRIARHICVIEEAAHSEGYCTLGVQQLLAWAADAEAFAVIALLNGQHMGHYVMLRIPESMAADIACYRRSKYDIREADICDPAECGSQVIMAIYAANPAVAAQLKAKAYCHLFAQRSVTDSLVILSTRRPGCELTAAYGIAEVAHGTDPDSGVLWWGMRSPAADILYADNIVKAVF